MSDEPIKCPSCNAPVSVEFQSKLRDRTRVTFEITQEPGYRLSAGTLGGLLVENEKLFKAVAREHGTTLTVLVDDIRMQNDKTAIDFVLAVPERKAKQKSKDAKDSVDRMETE